MGGCARIARPLEFFVVFLTVKKKKQKRRRLTENEKVICDNMITFNGGSLGSCIDEERSQLRYVVWIAEFSESSNLWTQMALLVIPGACLSECWSNRRMRGRVRPRIRLGRRAAAAARPSKCHRSEQAAVRTRPKVRASFRPCQHDEGASENLSSTVLN